MLTFCILALFLSGTAMFTFLFNSMLNNLVEDEIDITFKHKATASIFGGIISLTYSVLMFKIMHYAVMVVNEPYYTLSLIVSQVVVAAILLFFDYIMNKRIINALKGNTSNG